MRGTTMVPVTILTLAAGLVSLGATSAPVDLANGPLTSGVSKLVAPNVFFILDDSTSMNDDFMPDDVDSHDDDNCFKNFGYNTIYYNPATNYASPKNANGTDFAATNSTFTAAKVNGFSATSATTNLSDTTSQAVNSTVQRALGNNPFATTNFSRNVTVTQTAHGLSSGTSVTFTGAVAFNNVTLNGTYSISNVTANTYRIQAATFANRTGAGGGANVKESHTVTTTVAVPDFGWYEYTANPTAPPATCAGDTEYTWRSPANAAEQRNYTNWYSYYRTRLLLMKSAAGRAFSGVDDKFRVGYTAISEPGTGASRFLKLSSFDAAQKTAWYAKLYGAGCPSGTCYTPLRGALSKAGRMYAGTLTGAKDASDPVQYSCQQNFSILTTDGYWNLEDETTTYKAKRENNVTDVGDQDGVSGTLRPYLDAGKYTNSLADIAMYYYKSDLRAAGALGGLNDDGVRIDVSKNNVPGAAQDTAKHQHMTTFTLGLGVSGTLAYTENYLSGGNADYNAILQGTKNWPDPQTSSTSYTVKARIDDLWHAAVNGRGQYLSAANPDALVSALSKTLAAISTTNAAAAAAATSSLEPVEGEDYAYVAQYSTGLWYGDLMAHEIDVSNGSLLPDVYWSARTKLATKLTPTTDTRSIYTFSATGTNKLKDFTSANLATEKAAGYFKSSATNPGGELLQFANWTAAQKAAATDDVMIQFLRGQSAYEDETTNTTRLFRDRTFALGDIVNAAPVFVKKPQFHYTDTGYTDFIDDNIDRAGTVYVGANDGMLHAFDADTGAERWAYVPTAVIPSLYKLADAGYANNHQFYVDGPITVGDAYNGSEWKTVLIGGLGRGGNAFYALDVTNPASPKALWEFGATQDADIGYSYGNPILTKRSSDNKWVVLVTSGYNNIAGDSKGRLYVLDAFTGAKLQEIITDNAVTDPNVSGLAKINNWVLSTLVENTTQYVYGGDLGGSVWRFDLTANTSQRIGRTSATAGNQPITVRPELARIRDGAGTYHRIVYFGTGRFLGLSDLAVNSTSSTVQQTIYAVKDTGGDLGELTNSGAMLVSQTLVATDASRTIPSPLAVNWATNNGWYVTLPLNERVNVDMKLQLGTLVALANAPEDDYCSLNGTSWLYALNFKTGGAVLTPADHTVGFPVGASLATGVTLIRLPNDKVIAVVTQSDTTISPMDIPLAPSGTGEVRRVGWREIR